jgi:hypothetical protein
MRWAILLAFSGTIWSYQSIKEGFKLNRDVASYMGPIYWMIVSLDSDMKSVGHISILIIVKHALRHMQVKNKRCQQEKCPTVSPASVCGRLNDL